MIKLLLGSAIVLLQASASAQAANLAKSLETLRAADRGEVAGREVAAAWRQVVEEATLAEILRAMDGAGPLATNWLRGAVDAVAERTMQAGEAVPTAALEQFVDDRRHAPRARRVAFEWLVKSVPQKRESLLASMLDDPSLELRYDAVAQLMEQAAAAKGAAQIGAYRTALSASRNIGQIEACAAALEKLDETVDLTEHLGFLTTWWLIGPFDNTDKKGFAIAYPPESAVDLEASYSGKVGTVRWQQHTTEEKYGLVDLNKAIDKHMGAVGYAVTEFYASQQTPAQLRLGTENANKIWLNDEPVDGTEAYHTSMKVDQYIRDVQLRPGRNVIRLKICQNEQTEDWAQSWSFQLRVTDRLGKALRSAPTEKTLQESPE